MKKIFYVDNQDKFDEFILQVRNCKIIAVDTEFYWRDTYHPILCLIQVALSKEICYLIDTIVLTDITAFGDIVKDESIVKIFHDPIHDLQILTNACSFKDPKNIFDTRRAAGFAGLKHILSLADLTNELLGIQLPKTETQTDWTKRPLTAEQIDYSVNDVIYLFEIYNILNAKCTDNGLIKWMTSEMKIYEDTKTYGETSVYEKYLKLKGIKRLTQKQLKLTKYLVAWRDKEAKSKNVPKTFVLRDKNILKIVRMEPQNIQDLKKMQLLKRELLKEYGLDIINIIKRVTLQNDDLAEIHRKLKLRISGNKLKSLKQYVASKAEEYNLPAELIASRGDLVTILEDIKTGCSKKNMLMNSWRKNIFSEYFREHKKEN